MATDQTLPSGLKPRHIAAVTLGNALEFYDFLTYSFFAIQIGHSLFPVTSAYGSLMASLATFGAGFVTRPIGALVIGTFGDRVGRKPAMLFSFVLMGVSIIAMALIPPYSRIGMAAPILAIVTRMAQGFSLGGEIGSNTSYLLEAALPERRGLIVSWQGASQEAALVAGSLVGVGLSTYLSTPQLDAYGWRIAFLVGGIVVPFGLWLRSNLPETLHAPEPQGLAPQASVTEARLALAKRHWRIMVLGGVILGSATIANYVSVYIVTYAQDTLHLSARTGFIAETVNTLVGMCVGLIGGWFSDRYGRRPINIWTNAALLLTTLPLFLWVVDTGSATALIVSMAILGVFGNFSFGAQLAMIGESLPKAIRVTGFGTVYSVAIAALGGTTQFVVTWLIHITGSPLAPAWYVVGAAAIAQIAYFLIPESAPVGVKTRAVTREALAE